jgi:flavin-binding protein dodecin
MCSTTDGGRAMSDHVYKTIELTGSSKTSSDEAIRCAIERASKTVRDMRWFEVTNVRGQVESGKLAHWQVTVKVGFTLE